MGTPVARLSRRVDAGSRRPWCWWRTPYAVSVGETQLCAGVGAFLADHVLAARATGLTNLPLHDAVRNQFWLEIVQIALDLVPRL